MASVSAHFIKYLCAQKTGIKIGTEEKHIRHVPFNLFVSLLLSSHVYIWTRGLILAPLFTFIYLLKGFEWSSETFFTVTQAACQCHNRHVMKGLCLTSRPAANDAKMLKFSNNSHPVSVSVSHSGASFCYLPVNICGMYTRPATTHSTPFSLKLRHPK